MLSKKPAAKAAATKKPPAKMPAGPKLEETLFAKYAAGGSENITPEGLAKLCENLKLDMSNDVMIELGKEMN